MQSLRTTETFTVTPGSLECEAEAVADAMRRVISRAVETGGSEQYIDRVCIERRDDIVPRLWGGDDGPVQCMEIAVTTVLE